MKVISYGDVEIQSVDGGEITYRYVNIDLGDGINKKIKINTFISKNGEESRDYIEEIKEFEGKEFGEEIKNDNLLKSLMDYPSNH